ncbi:hypothetical protein Scep_005747 [Stephania cephalantha]|uniref:Gamma-interferon-inducible lysosomal thiol reductase n=1 Tax=Stephania cephalantha TaxID=152367 RepID=A0AAP0PWN9_9MAGN
MALICRSVSLFLLCYLVCLSGSSVSAQKVSLALYYETLCPFCSNFIVDGLSKIFHNGLVDIVDLRLVPFGNAEIGSDDKTITCQHGPGECFLNTLEACAIYAWPDLNTHFAFIYCIEHLVAEGKVKQWQSCFEKTGLDSAPIADCYKSGLGTKLELQYGNETKSLVPPHEYVPWVIVNNKPLYTDYANFTTYVCKAYNGTAPSVCNETTFQLAANAESDQTPQACLRKRASIASVPRPPPITSHMSSGRRQMKMAISE